MAERAIIAAIQSGNRDVAIKLIQESNQPSIDIFAEAINDMNSSGNKNILIALINKFPYGITDLNNQYSDNMSLYYDILDGTKDNIIWFIDYILNNVGQKAFSDNVRWRSFLMCALRSNTDTEKVIEVLKHYIARTGYDIDSKDANSPIQLMLGHFGAYYDESPSAYIDKLEPMLKIFTAEFLRRLIVLGYDLNKKKLLNVMLDNLRYLPFLYLSAHDNDDSLLQVLLDFTDFEKDLDTILKEHYSDYRFAPILSEMLTSMKRKGTLDRILNLPDDHEIKKLIYFSLAEIIGLDNTTTFNKFIKAMPIDPNKIYYVGYKMRYRSYGILQGKDDERKNFAYLLHMAVAHNSPKIVKRLLEMGADINQEDQFGKTPCFYLKGDANETEIMRRLVCPEHILSEKMKNVKSRIIADRMHNRRFYYGRGYNPVQHMESMLKTNATRRRAHLLGLLNKADGAGAGAGAGGQLEGGRRKKKIYRRISTRRR